MRVTPLDKSFFILAILRAKWFEQVGVKLVFLEKLGDLFPLEEYRVSLHSIPWELGDYTGEISSFLEMKPMLKGGPSTLAPTNHEVLYGNAYL